MLFYGYEHEKEIIELVNFNFKLLQFQLQPNLQYNFSLPEAVNEKPPVFYLIVYTKIPPILERHIEAAN